jgi:alpha-1,2-mannosyltransferase
MQVLRSWRAGVLAAVAVAVVAGQVWYGNRHGFYDLKIYASAMRWWTDGHPLYEYTKPDATQGQLGFTYPPFAAVLFSPLALLPTGVFVWLYAILATAALVALTRWLLVPEARRHGQPVWFVVTTGFLLITALEPIREAFTFGQINFLLWLLVLLDLLVLAPRGSRFTGVGVGLATAIKLVPGVFILYLLATRRWRAAAVSVGTFLAATLLAAAIAPKDSWTFWSDKVIHGEGVGQLTYIFNQSIMGVLARAAAPGQPSTALWAALAVAIVGYGLWRAARAAYAGDEVAGLTLTGIAGSLASPVTWVHHLFWFVPALVVLVDAALRRRHEPDAVLSGVRPIGALWTVATIVYATVTFSVVSIYAFNMGEPGGFLRWSLGNWDVLLMLVLLPVLPIRRSASDAEQSVTKIGNYATAREKTTDYLNEAAAA